LYLNKLFVKYTYELQHVNGTGVKFVHAQSSAQCTSSGHKGRARCGRLRRELREGAWSQQTGRPKCSRSRTVGGNTRQSLCPEEKRSGGGRMTVRGLVRQAKKSGQRLAENSEF
jgi:hypothetical protein